MAKKKVALFGYNKVSRAAASRLAKGPYDVLVVDLDEQRLEQASAKGFATLAIDFRSDDALHAMGIGRDIEMIFCFFAEDSENVFLTISARAIAPRLSIIAIVKDPESADKLLAAGADKIINPYEICGRKIYELIKKPVITDILDHTVFGRDDLNMAEVEIPLGSVLENTQLSDLNLEKKFNLILIGVVDKELGSDLLFSIGDQDHKLDAGDILVVLGPAQEIAAFYNEI